MMHTNSTVDSVKTIKIMLADDHQLFREGLKRILNMEDDFEVIAECTNGQEVIMYLHDVGEPDIILMDINMPILNGVQATRQINEQFYRSKVMILSIHDDESYVFETLRSGASGYLLKDMEADSLVTAIRNVAEGYSYIHPKVTGKLIRQLRRMTIVDSHGVLHHKSIIRETAMEEMKDVKLTKRETEVLRFLTDGMSNKAIGDQLIISEKTVKNHVSSILQKLECEDRTQAVIKAVKNGWVAL